MKDTIKALGICLVIALVIMLLCYGPTVTIG
jgi:hypothetical protein